MSHFDSIVDLVAGVHDYRVLRLQPRQYLSIVGITLPQLEDLEAGPSILHDKHSSVLALAEKGTGGDAHNVVTSPHDDTRLHPVVVP